MGRTSKGMTTGVGICTYFSLLFESNEVAPTKYKLTDDEIAAKVEAEFPSRKTAFCFRGRTQTRTINEYRQRYNKGLFSPGKSPPKRCSLRYDRHGRIVDSRTGSIRLTPEEVQLIRENHGRQGVESL